MLKWTIILCVILIIVGYLYFYYKDIQDRIDYEFRIKSFSGGSGIVPTIKINYEVILKNKSNATIRFNDLDLFVFYKNDEIARSLDKTGKVQKLGAFGTPDATLSYTGTVTVNINSALFNTLMNAYTAKEIELGYKVYLKATILQIPVIHSGTIKHKL